MQIALNAQLIHMGDSYRAAGVSGYSLHLLRALGQLRLQGQLGHSLHAFVNAPGLVVPGVELRQSTLPLDNPLVRIAWEQSALPLALARHGDKLVHGLVNVLPLATNMPGVVTVHDLSFVHTPEALPRAKRTYLDLLCRKSVAKASHVIAVSGQTAADLMAHYQTPASKILVIHNGVGEEFTPEAPLVADAKPGRYLLYVGTLEPRKNLPLLIGAYARWRETTSSANHDIRLVLGGGKGWGYQEVYDLVQGAGLERMVDFPGFLPAADLPGWYRGALAFVYPSKFEGFGLPVLEAMACGTPTITSRAPSLLEVAGEAALTFPSDNLAALADCIELVVEQGALRGELRRLGIERAARFSWKRAAEETAQVYERVLAGAK